MSVAFSTARLQAEPLSLAAHDQELAGLHADPRVMATMGGSTATPEESRAWIERNLRHGQEPGLGIFVFRERFSSKVTLHPKTLIDVEYINGPFRYLNNHWKFEPHPEGCIVDFYVAFEFRSRILQNLIGLLFNEAVPRMVGAFEARAQKLYQPADENGGSPQLGRGPAVG